MFARAAALLLMLMAVGCAVPSTPTGGADDNSPNGVRVQDYSWTAPRQGKLHECKVFTHDRDIFGGPTGASASIAVWCT